MTYPKQKDSKREIRGDMRRFAKTARKTKKCNVNPRIMRGGIRL